MDTKKLTELEYEAQFYKSIFNSYTILGYVKDTLTQAINKCFDNLEQIERVSLPEKLDNDEISKCKTMYLEALEKHLDALKPATKKMFSIPDNIVLNSDRRHQEFENKIDELKMEINELENTYKQQQMFLEFLELEIQEFLKFEPIQIKVNKLLKTNKNNNVNKNEKKKLLKNQSHHLKMLFENQWKERLYLNEEDEETEKHKTY